MNLVTTQLCNNKRNYSGNCKVRFSVNYSFFVVVGNVSNREQTSQLEPQPTCLESCNVSPFETLLSQKRAVIFNVNNNMEMQMVAWMSVCCAFERDAVTMRR